MMFFLLIIAAVVVFKAWLGLGLITSGDLGYFYPEQIKQYFNIPFTWEIFRGSGLGGISFISHGVYFYNLPMGFLGHFLSYPIIERMLWFWPILFIGLISPFFLVKELKLFPSKFYPYSSLIFFLNTYFLMMMGGGQLTVALAYIIMPLVLALFLKAVREDNLKNIIFFSIALIFLVAWDFRFTYLFGIILCLYLLIFLPETLKNLRKYFKIFLISGFFVLGLNAFWLLPFLLNFSNPAASFSPNYTTTDAVKFFSFADFSHTLSLLHPNWPENIFGKTYFMQWEFLLIPIFAFSSLLFLKNQIAQLLNCSIVKKNQQKHATMRQCENATMVLFFALLGLIGAFLAKGANEPFGGIYLWIFEHVPGMVMFRDPTKFYTLVALSYSVLIPYSLWKICDWIKEKYNSLTLPESGIRKYLPNLFLIFTTLYLILLIKPAWMGELGGNFKIKKVPKEYMDLKNFIVKQPEFFRTFWIPTKQRFTYYDNNHPAIDGIDFLNVASASGLIDQLKEKNTQDKLILAGVKYLVLPFDSEGEIFIKDRIYDDQGREAIEKELTEVKGLKKILFNNLGNQTKTIVYETSKYNDRFWLESGSVIENSKVEWRMINPTKYEIKINNLQTPSFLVFSENFDPRWEIKINNKIISSTKVYNGLNSFKIESTGFNQFFVEFKPQKYLQVGLVISGLTILLILFGLLKNIKGKRFLGS